MPIPAWLAGAFVKAVEVLATAAVSALTAAFATKPEPQNHTVKTAEKNAQLQQVVAQLKEKEAEIAHMKELQACLLKAESELRKRAEKDAEEAKRRAEAAAKSYNPQVLKTAQKEAEEAQKRAAAAVEREKDARVGLKVAQKAVDEEHNAREKLEEELQNLKVAVEKGIAPLKWPTQEEVSAAKAAINYDPELLHFAICGTAGSGKSSLINALRGVLSSNTRHAAKVGIVEATAKTMRYPDPREGFPYSRVVWYDIPGAGTLNIPDWQYFIDQHLFIFDFIVMVYDIRFTKIDVGILENCMRFKIPVFVVRSKADQHIENMVKIERRKEEEEDEDDDEDDDIEVAKEGLNAEKRRVKRCRGEYIKQTRADFRRNLQKMIADRPASTHPYLLKQNVYIVSADVMHRYMTAKTERKITRLKEEIIDESRLVKNMLKESLIRRYSWEEDAAEELLSREGLVN